MESPDLSEKARALAEARQIVEGHCVFCGELMQGTRKRRYCSHSCQQRAHYRRNRNVGARQVAVSEGAQLLRDQLRNSGMSPDQPKYQEALMADGHAPEVPDAGISVIAEIAANLYKATLSLSEHDISIVQETIRKLRNSSPEKETRIIKDMGA
jgi:hypothetical protein